MIRGREEWMTFMRTTFFLTPEKVPVRLPPHFQKLKRTAPGVSSSNTAITSRPVIPSEGVKVRSVLF